MEKKKKQCRICYKTRQCVNLDNRFKMKKNIWKNGFYVINGLWVCKECRKNKQDKIQKIIEKINIGL